MSIWARIFKRLVYVKLGGQKQTLTLIRRMSEDIDLKVTAEKEPSRSELRRLRESMTAALLHAGFRFDPDNPEHRRMGNQNRYTIYRLPYEPLARGQGALRPEIKIEVTVWPMWRPAVQLPVASFISEALRQPAEIANLGCVSITQTAAEKFVALTRKTAAELAEAAGPRDPALSRHIYDLYIIRDRFDIAEVASLAREIVRQDAEAFGNQFPAYREDPSAETRRAVAALAGDARYEQRYLQFQRDMVYGDRPTYRDAMQTTLAIARGFHGEC